MAPAVGRLPAGPLRDELRARRINQTRLAEEAGVTNDYVRFIVGDRLRTIPLDVADRVCLALGTHLSLVYQ